MNCRLLLSLHSHQKQLGKLGYVSIWTCWGGAAEPYSPWIWHKIPNRPWQLWATTLCFGHLLGYYLMKGFALPCSSFRPGENYTAQFRFYTHLWPFRPESGLKSVHSNGALWLLSSASVQLRMLVCQRRRSKNSGSFASGLSQTSYHLSARQQLPYKWQQANINLFWGPTECLSSPPPEFKKYLNK